MCIPSEHTHFAKPATSTTMMFLHLYVRDDNGMQHNAFRKAAYDTKSPHKRAHDLDSG